MRKSIASKITPNRKLIRKSASRQDLRGLSEKVKNIIFSLILYLIKFPLIKFLTFLGGGGGMA